MYSVHITALLVAASSLVACETFFSVPVGLDKTAVKAAFVAHGIQGFDPNATPNPNGLYMADSKQRLLGPARPQSDPPAPAAMESMESMESVAANPQASPMPPQQQPQQQPQQPQQPQQHPVAVRPNAISAEFGPTGAPPQPMASGGSGMAALQQGPPPGHPVAVPLAPARGPRPGLLSPAPGAPAANPNVIAQQPMAPAPAPTQMQLLAQMPAPGVAANMGGDRGVLTSTVIVMATAAAPAPQAQAQVPAALVGGRQGGGMAAMNAAGATEYGEELVEEEDVDDDSAGASSPAPAAGKGAVPPASRATTPSGSTGPAAESSAHALPSLLSTTAAAAAAASGPMKLKPLMFAKANMSAFKPEDIDKFTFPTTELSVNMAGPGKDSASSTQEHVESSTATAMATSGGAEFKGSMPGDRAKPKASSNSNAVVRTAANGGSAQSSAVGGEKPKTLRTSGGSMGGQAGASAGAAGPAGPDGPQSDGKDSSSAHSMQQSAAAAMVLAAAIHAAVAMF